jgi:hypothetical protein
VRLEIIENKHIFLAFLEPAVFGLVKKVGADAQDSVMGVKLDFLRTNIESQVRVPGGIQ